jgi:hypothetical protein
VHHRSRGGEQSIQIQLPEQPPYTLQTHRLFLLHAPEACPTAQPHSARQALSTSDPPPITAVVMPSAAAVAAAAGWVGLAAAAERVGAIAPGAVVACTTHAAMQACHMALLAWNGYGEVH